MGTLEISKLNGGTSKVDTDTIGNFRGEVITPDNPAYDEARQVWNAMIDKRPGLILRPTGVADVQAAVRFAIAHNLLISVKGGGHNIAGSAVCEGGLMIDLSNMRAVRVFASERRVSVQGGALLGDIDHETQAFELAVPLGINSTTGVAGLALGGGFGWLSRKYGHTADNILSMDVVTPDGEFRHASEHENTDLFWALRGGSGNFGIVTSFDFRCYPLNPSFLSGPVIFAIDDAAAALREYRRIAKELPDEATCSFVFRKAPPFPFLDARHHGETVLILAMTYVGSISDGEKILAPLRAIGSPIGDGVSPHPFVGWQAAFDPLVAPRVRNYWKSNDFIDLPDEIIEIMVAAAEQMPSDECEVFTAHLGGASGQIATDKIAFPHRSHNFTMSAHGRWQDQKQDQECMAWVRKFFADTTAYATGGVYVNFVPEEEDGREIGPYGENQTRLETIKYLIDPENRFRSNVNILPVEKT